MRSKHLENLNLEKKIIESSEHLLQHEKKIYIFDNLTEIASLSLSDFFEKVRDYSWKFSIKQKFGKSMNKL